MPYDWSSRWLTVREFADELGVSISTAYKWSAAGTASGRFPRHTTPNRSIRIRRDWLDDRMTHHGSIPLPPPPPPAGAGPPGVPLPSPTASAAPPFPPPPPPPPASSRSSPT